MMSLNNQETNSLQAIEHKIQKCLSMVATDPDHPGLRKELEQAQLILKNETARIATEILRQSRRLDDGDIPGGSSASDLDPILFHSLQDKLTPQSSLVGQIPGDPGSDIHRQAANRIFKVPLPRISSANISTTDPSHSKSISESTKAELFKNRPCVDQTQKEKLELGILRLIERKLIPPTANLTIQPPPFDQHQIVPEEREKFTRQKVHFDDKMQLSIYKLDKDYNSENKPKALETATQTVSSQQQQQKAITLRKHPSSTENQAVPQNSRIQSAVAASSGSRPVTIQPVSTAYQPQFELSINQPNPFATMENFKSSILPEQKTTTKIRHELTAARKIYDRLSDIVFEYSIPKLIVDSERLLQQGSENLLTTHLLTVKQIISFCAVNFVEVQTLIAIPGRKYQHPNRDLALEKAATKIQATYRSYKYNKQYRLFRKKRWAAGVIAISWIMYVRMAKMKRRLITSRKRQIEYHDKQVKETLVNNWAGMKNGCCVIHVPSFSYQLPVRLHMDDLPVRQACQWGRLADVFNPHVEKVIYVLPCLMSLEIQNYYRTIIGIKNQSLFKKIHFIQPEALHSFPTHNMALSTLLKYSPDALNEIKSLISSYKDRCYINGAVPNHDDLSVSEFLNVPLLAPEWKTIDKFAYSKSNTVDSIKESGVESPPSRTGLYEREDIARSLAELIIAYPDCSTWLIKLNQNVDGRGIHRLELQEDTLPCFSWLQTEISKFGEQWKFPWAHEAALNRLLRELPIVIEKHAVCQRNDIVKNKRMYETWAEFETAISKYGCLVEAEIPEAENMQVTAIVADVFIPPGHSNYELLCTSDQLHAGSHLQHWGSTFPQTSIERKVLKKSLDKVMKQLIQKENMQGHLSVSFLTYYDDNDEQVLNCFDFKIGMSNHLAMYNLGKCLSERAPEATTEKQPALYMSVCPNMVHTNLNCVHYSVLFQMLRAYAVGWDASLRRGVILTLLDPAHRDHIGVISISYGNLEKSLGGLARAMAVVAKEISSPNMKGETNFYRAIDEIDVILQSIRAEKVKGGILEVHEDD